MIVLISREFKHKFFKVKNPSASMLTCRRHTVDTPQTMTLTMVQTFDEQEGSIRPFPERYGIISLILEKALFSPIFGFSFKLSSQNGFLL
jgi:hypothetical protein